MRDALIIAAVMGISFWVGQSYGLKQAPEYVAMKEREDAAFEARMAEIDVAYEGSQDQACDRMIDMAQDIMADRLAPPPPDPRDR